MPNKTRVIFTGTKAVVEVDTKDLLWIDGYLFYIPTGQTCKQADKEEAR